MYANLRGLHKPNVYIDLSGILPILTPLAAVGRALTMVGAAITHLRRRENSMIGLNVVLLVLAAPSPDYVALRMALYAIRQRNLSSLGTRI